TDTDVDADAASLGLPPRQPPPLLRQLSNSKPSVSFYEEPGADEGADSDADDALEHDAGDLFDDNDDDDSMDEDTTLARHQSVVIDLVADTSPRWSTEIHSHGSSFQNYAAAGSALSHWHNTDSDNLALLQAWLRLVLPPERQPTGEAHILPPPWLVEAVRDWALDAESPGVKLVAITHLLETFRGNVVGDVGMPVTPFAYVCFRSDPALAPTAATADDEDETPVALRFCRLIADPLAVLCNDDKRNFDGRPLLQAPASESDTLPPLILAIDGVDALPPDVLQDLCLTIAGEAARLPFSAANARSAPSKRLRHRRMTPPLTPLLGSVELGGVNQRRNLTQLATSLVPLVFDDPDASDADALEEDASALTEKSHGCFLWTS
ncbi:hypothetical protein HK405_003667, partial [Cladochytrium tenue]